MEIFRKNLLQQDIKAMTVIDCIPTEETLLNSSNDNIIPNDVSASISVQGEDCDDTSSKKSDEDVDNEISTVVITSENGGTKSISSSSLSYPPPPRRPKPAYNIFFQMERKRILDEYDENMSNANNSKDKENSTETDVRGSHQASRREYTAEEIATFIRQANEQQTNEDNEPDNVNDRLLYGSSKKTKRRRKKKKNDRRHVKSHGKIGFSELSREVSYRWKNCLSTTERNAFKKSFEQEMVRYRVNFREWQKNKHKIRLQYSSKQQEQEKSKLEDLSPLSSCLEKNDTSSTSPANNEANIIQEIAKHNRMESALVEDEEKMISRRSDSIDHGFKTYHTCSNPCSNNNNKDLSPCSRQYDNKNFVDVYYCLKNKAPILSSRAVRHKGPGNLNSSCTSVSPLVLKNKLQKGISDVDRDVTIPFVPRRSGNVEENQDDCTSGSKFDSTHYLNQTHRISAMEREHKRDIDEILIHEREVEILQHTLETLKQRQENLQQGQDSQAVEAVARQCTMLQNKIQKQEDESPLPNPTSPFRTAHNAYSHPQTQMSWKDYYIDINNHNHVHLQGNHNNLESGTSDVQNMTTESWRKLDGKLNHNIPSSPRIKQARKVKILRDLVKLKRQLLYNEMLLEKQENDEMAVRKDQIKRQKLYHNVDDGKNYQYQQLCNGSQYNAYSLIHDSLPSQKSSLSSHHNIHDNSYHSNHCEISYNQGNTYYQNACNGITSRPHNLESVMIKTSNANENPSTKSNFFIPVENNMCIFPSRHPGSSIDPVVVGHSFKQDSAKVSLMQDDREYRLDSSDAAQMMQYSPAFGGDTSNVNSKALYELKSNYDIPSSHVNTNIISSNTSKHNEESSGRQVNKMTSRVPELIEFHEGNNKNESNQCLSENRSKKIHVKEESSQNEMFRSFVPTNTNQLIHHTSSLQRNESLSLKRQTSIGSFRESFSGRDSIDEFIQENATLLLSSESQKLDEHPIEDDLGTIDFSRMQDDDHGTIATSRSTLSIKDARNHLKF